MTSSDARAVDLHIFGVVQGVSYRATCAQKADHLGVAGWVRNEDDGSVKVHAEGDPDAVESLIDWCHDGPAHAQVDDVEVRDVAPQGMSAFE